MKLILNRVALKKTYTIGKLYEEKEDGSLVYICDTLEDQVRDASAPKVRGETAIPFGTYKIEFRRSPAFNRVMPYLLSVPNFQGVMIHAGNTASDSRGCILCGENKEVGRVINSRKTFERLFSLIDGKDVTIKIK